MKILRANFFKILLVLNLNKNGLKLLKIKSLVLNFSLLILRILFYFILNNIYKIFIISKLFLKKYFKLNLK